MSGKKRFQLFRTNTFHGFTKNDRPGHISDDVPCTSNLDKGQNSKCKPKLNRSISTNESSSSNTGNNNLSCRRNGIIHYLPSCQVRRNGLIPNSDNKQDEICTDTGQRSSEIAVRASTATDSGFTVHTSNVSEKGITPTPTIKPNMKKLTSNAAFRHTFSDSSDVRSCYKDKYRSDGKKKYKSLSLDGAHHATIPECLNPVYLNYGCDSLETSIDLEGCVKDESSTDQIQDDTSSVFSESAPSEFDISGAKGRSLYPWQREIGIQCNLLRISSTDSENEVLQSSYNNSSSSGCKPNPKVKLGSLKFMRGCNSLDSSQKLQQSLLSQRLGKIREWEAEAAKKRPYSSSDASADEEQQDIHKCSKTCSYTISKPSSFYRTGSTTTINQYGSGSFDSLDKTNKVYGSTSNISPSKTEFGYLDFTNRNDILPSPPLSPKHWLTSSTRCPLVKVYSPDDSKRKGEREDGSSKLVRRKSSDSIHSNEEDSDSEPSPTMLRQGRRKAIFDSMALGVITAPDGDLSPSNSCDESESSNTMSGPLGDKIRNPSLPAERKFHDDLSTVQRKKVLIKRNTVHDFATNKSYQTVFNEQDSKKNKSSFSLVMKLIDKKGHKGKDSLADLSDVLQTIKPTEFKDHSLISYKTLHWSELIASKEKEKDVLTVSEGEIKRREAVWELFKSECVFLVDHLMVLKHCFMEPMKKVQVEGHLMFAEPQDLFGNLDELCYVSYTFCKDFISLLLKDARVSDFGRTEVLVKALQRLSQLSRDGEVYHDYCLNYSKAVNYLEILRKNDKFCDFERWCENDPRCHRLQLTDLLISPMQHCTKVPLLLFNIRKYTPDIAEREQLTHSLEKLETSLKKLEAKMNWLKNFERVQEIQQQIQWPPVTELDQKAYIPEFLKPTLSRQPCERLLASPKRQLLHEGPVTLIEISKALDMYMFLFDDILLLTKVKKQPRKKSDGDRNPYAQRAHTEGAVFVVHRQPIALDRFTVHDVQPPDNSVCPTSDPCPFSCTSARGVTSSFQGDGYQPLINVSMSMDEDEQGLGNLFFGCVSVANGLRHSFVLVQISRFQQIIGVFTIQAPNEATKEIWMTKLKEAQDKYKDGLSSHKKQKVGLHQTNSVLISCDDLPDNVAMEDCIMSCVENNNKSNELHQSSSNKGSTVQQQQNTGIHEPIICTPQANFSRAKNMSSKNNNEVDVQTDNCIGLEESVSSSMLSMGLSNRSILDSNGVVSSVFPVSNRSVNVQAVQRDINNRPLQEHSTQTEQKSKPKLRKQMTGIGMQTLLADKVPPSKSRGDDKISFNGSSINNSQRISKSDMESVKHLISPTKIQTMRYNEAHCNGNSNSMTLDEGYIQNMLHESNSDELLTVSITSQDQSSSVEEVVLDTDDLEQSPLLGEKQSKSKEIYNNRNRDKHSVSKLSRLKAIHEKSQSIDVIYI